MKKTGTAIVLALAAAIVAVGAGQASADSAPQADATIAAQTAPQAPVSAGTLIAMDTNWGG
ncbi:hypothetical protein [Kitasatospora sp. NPDC001175]|uniref:hypothetical protein n=1 Tax=Kitasatospora sp. NPDC001175 TaxID=3157103 RepID=UPI003D02B997